MPVIVEKDGQQRHMGDPQYKRLKGQGKLNGYSLVKSVPYNKPGSGTAQGNKAQTETVNLPEEVTKFQQKTVAEREQEALNKAYQNMGEKGKLFEIPDDYTGDPALLKVSALPVATPAAETVKTETGSEKTEASAQQASTETSGKAASADQKTQAAAKASPAASTGKKGS